MTEKNKEVAVKENKAVGAVNPIEAFKEANPGMEFDEVNLGVPLKINSKGQFCAKQDETVVFNEFKEIIVLSGKPQFVLWGKDDTPDEGELLIDAENLIDARDAFAARCADAKMGEVFKATYKEDDISHRYTIQFMAEDGNCYELNMSNTSRKAYKKYATQLFNGFLGAPRQTGVAVCVTKMTTEAKSWEKVNWNQCKFEFVRKIEA